MDPTICESIEQIAAAHANYKAALAVAQANPDSVTAWRALFGCHIAMQQATEALDAAIDDTFPMFCGVLLALQS